MTTEVVKDRFEFDEALHRYTLNGRPLISVTQVLKMAGFYRNLEKVPQHVLDVANARGTDAHLATELYDNRKLDITTVRADVMPYLNSWIAFLRHTNAQVLHAEVRGYSKKWGFAFTLDRLLWMGGKLWLIDLKCTFEISPATAIQTGGYKIGVEEYLGIKVERRGCVQLQNDGSLAKLEPYEDKNDEAIFLQALNVARWQIQKGIC